jgi:GNAT superfamily N-acetyltransferase
MQKINRLMNAVLTLGRGLGVSRPSNRQSMTVTLSDGTDVIIRPIHNEDCRALMGMYQRLSRNTLYFRYLAFSKPRWEEIESLCHLGEERGVVLIATPLDSPETVIAIAHYELDLGLGPGVAEPAIVVEDRHQGKGLGSLLLRELIQLARRRGVLKFRAVVHPDNGAIRNLLHRSGYPVEEEPDDEVIHAEIRLDSDPSATSPSLPNGAGAAAWFVNTEWIAI